MKRKITLWCSVLIAVYGLLASQARASLGLWSSSAELQSVPMSGSAWTVMLGRANESTASPNVGDQDDPTNVRVLAAAIVYARNGDVAYKNKVKTALQAVVATGNPGDRTLAWARETGAYALAADLIDYQSDAGNPAFRTWLRNMAEVYLSAESPPRTMLAMYKDRPNNWGTHGFGSLVCIYAYLQDTARLNEIRNYWIAGVVGPNPGFVYDSNVSWHIDTGNLRIYNPAGAIKSGVNIDGVMPDDMRRGGSFANPPAFTGYAWEAQQGPIMAARVLGRIGMSIWETGDMAIYRSAYRLQVAWAAAYGSQWQAGGDDAWMMPFLDSAYGSSFNTGQTGVWDSGKNTGFGFVTLADGTPPPPQVAAPSFSPAAGTYTSAQSVTITSATSGASIRYTTDGSTPTSTTGTVYSAPVSIGATTTLKAIAYKSGMTDSTVTTGVYTINLAQVAAPSFSPAAGTYASAQSVTITSATSGASIRYTTDGSTPTSTTGTLYSAPVSIAVTTTLKAIAYKSGMSNSTVTTGVYTINLAQVAAPSFSPAAGTYSSAQSVTITSATSGASIRYTTDGSTPTSSTGTLYSAPVSIAVTTTLKAIAYKSGMTDSTVTTGVYTISGGGGGTFNLVTTADTFVEGGSPTTNFNSTTYLRVKNGSGDTNDRWTYLKFDLSSVTGTVQTATLKLKLKALTNGSPATAFIYSVTTDSWTETGLNWNNKPAPVTLLASNTALSTVDAVYSFTVTSFVAAQNTGDRIVTIAIRDDNQVAKAADFYRREDGAANAATLTVVTQ